MGGERAPKSPGGVTATQARQSRTSWPPPFLDRLKIRKAAPNKRWCADLDDDCRLVRDKLGCWLYDPARGLCPYLSAERPPPDSDAPRS